ncbi:MULTISPECIES: hypothetical protein [Kitasatospora]|uniref:Uncharacterized protein n=1 Tax=Kitasatospora setae (strain ATCC 33774 / DSM 43861 / JCM 3304 / KCC A-0304 / NBRC 14216 / KM-6054) TaxID=452652 RepID=E4N4E7_KITSK|nr:MULTISPECIES: hypothetical protein [Kitasatospora]BAJ26078.1 hypothetical protein KSE_02275 [Kitasatospora setae KM-6054]
MPSSSEVVDSEPVCTSARVTVPLILASESLSEIRAVSVAENGAVRAAISASSSAAPGAPGAAPLSESVGEAGAGRSPSAAGPPEQPVRAARATPAVQPRNFEIDTGILRATIRAYDRRWRCFRRSSAQGKVVW